MIIKRTVLSSFIILLTGAICFTVQAQKIDDTDRVNFSGEWKSKESISFAAYQPHSKQISLYTKDRQILDIFRSLAHEMVHYSQDLKHDNLDGRTGSPHENEANAVAGQIMRKYNKLHADLF
jgi:hypothetical protein